MHIIDLLRPSAATVKELAAAMDVPPKSLYYHVSLLEKHGLIRVVETRVVSGILEKRYRATAYRFNFSELGSAPDVAPGQYVTETVSSLFAMTREDIERGLEAGLIDPAEDAAAGTHLALSWDLLDMSPVQREEMEERIAALVREYSSSGPAAPEQQTYRYFFMLFPTRGGRIPEDRHVEDGGEA
jgi:DNA-binding transcriptional ArsR family regulator